MTNLITSYQNLILFEAAAQYTKEDPCKYQRYAPLLQDFMEQMAKNYSPTSATPPPPSLPLSGLSESFRAFPFGSILKYALHDKTFKEFELLAGKKESFSESTKALALLTKNAFQKIKDETLTPQEDSPQHFATFSQVFSKFSTAWCQDYSSAENQILGPVRSAITLCQNEKASLRFCFNGMAQAATQLEIITSLQRSDFLKLLLAPSTPSTPPHMRFLQEAFQAAYQKAHAKLSRLDATSVSLEDLESADVCSSLFSLFNFYEHASALHKHPSLHRLCAHFKPGQTSSKNQTVYMRKKALLEDLKKGTTPYSSSSHFTKFYSQAREAYQELSEEEKSTLHSHSLQSRDCQNKKIKKLLTPLQTCALLEGAHSEDPSIHRLLNMSCALLSNAS